ncbi:MAG TPA: DUF3579 domain-containing protein [Burkholderiaceae bacterium]|nr:DUF3579 domain-containing protein [Burkholderiaceae bacterium]
MTDSIPVTPSSAHRSRELFIQGVTRAGRTFRPSDWAERLCGVMAQFQPEGGDPSRAHIGYSPYVRPTIVHGIKCVIVDERLRELEPLAWNFVLDFARDNDLQTGEACEVPLDRAPPKS